MDVSLKSGFIILETSLEYNDEIYYQQEGYYLSGNKLYSTREEAKKALRQRAIASFGGLGLTDLYYDGEEPQLIRTYLEDKAMDEDPELQIEDVQNMTLWDFKNVKVTQYIDDSELSGQDWNEVLNLYNIAEVQFA